MFRERCLTELFIRLIRSQAMMLLEVPAASRTSSFQVRWRSYGRQTPRQATATVKPLEVISRKKKPKPPAVGPAKRVDSDETAFRKLDPDLRKQIMDLDDADADFNVNTGHLMYDEYQREAQALYEKTQALKMTRKHYKPFISKELNLMTFAEKEKIRFLHSQCNWSVEMLSDAFPISKFGVDRLLHSKYHPLTEKELERHDQHVVDILHQIKNGEIELTIELAERMKKRAQLPVYVGAKWIPEQYDSSTGDGGFSMEDNKPKREPGEFERLVIIPQYEPKKPEQKQIEASSSSKSLSLEVQLNADKKTRRTEKDARKPADNSGARRPTFADQLESFADIRDVVRDYDGGDDEKAFRARNINPKRRITFNEFQKVFKPEERGK